MPTDILNLRIEEAPKAGFSFGHVLLLACACTLACASGASNTRGTAEKQTLLVPGASPQVTSENTLPLVGARCSAGECKCRQEGGQDDTETSPPSEGSKRFEIRMSAGGGSASLDLTGLGTVATTGPVEKCVYVDIPAGSQHDARFVAKEAQKGSGIAPKLKVTEYGPKGPFWYDVVAVACDAPDGKCDRHAAEQWGLLARQRRRGRIDPCGSAVVTQLAWETSGGQVERDGGLFRDFTVKFAMDVKKFATQFSPGAAECVPK